MDFSSDAAVKKSSTIPLLKSGEYYRAGSLGEGSFGSVVVVYDDEGNEYAAKSFELDEDEDEEQDSTSNGIDVGVLREISMLRILNGMAASRRHVGLEARSVTLACFPRAQGHTQVSCRLLTSQKWMANSL